MALEAFIRSQVVIAFNQLDDIAKRWTYVQRSGDPVRDVESGVTTYPSTEIVIPKAVKVRFKKDEKDAHGQTLVGEKVLFPRVFLPGDFETATSDYLVDQNDIIWEIISDLGDPASALAMFQVRSTRKKTP
ncbi:hypothetical protein phiCbK_230 [Caulobacter phage phiCbK]|uniref:Uncharacterized protein n=5 Tax=Viruses TaxID=10239 RepID=J3SVV1_9CAUD|nr:hypothetical protein D865_gp330 [Caulobacter phage phiCbK]ARB14304.1 hypothetical protein Ccr5_gp086 [Caulobacter phage Ccr5]ARB15005.1 hypothetical protein Ccr32_gp086 [Caulobacter phage Ccr32]ARB15336.1 hypothetical protein Ccr34_gp093 [Caulobacter phage Ccr34]AFO71746.1 hypothetical protein phiCbK_230 [Caulobacter phage phiCbK]AFU86920.1 hypothetical protein CbK_gp088 [Caulobacter phage phiCbK]